MPFPWENSSRLMERRVAPMQRRGSRPWWEWSGWVAALLSIKAEYLENKHWKELGRQFLVQLHKAIISIHVAAGGDSQIKETGQGVQVCRVEVTPTHHTFGSGSTWNRHLGAGMSVGSPEAVAGEMGPFLFLEALTYLSDSRLQVTGKPVFCVFFFFKIRFAILESLPFSFFRR